MRQTHCNLLKHRKINNYFRIGLRVHSSSSSSKWRPVIGRIGDFVREKPPRLAPNLDCPNIGGLLSSYDSTMATLRLLFPAPKRENGVERSAPICVMLAKERLPSFDSVPLISKSSSSSICCTFCDDGTNRRLGAAKV